MTTTKSKYEKLDSLILSKIGTCPQYFSQIGVREVADECKRVADEETKARGLSEWHAVEADRILDRRLQALRKAGKIRHTGMGWVLEGEAK